MRKRTPARRPRRVRRPARAGKKWVQTVTTVSTFPPRGLFTKDAPTIARVLATRRVSPKGIGSGYKMLLYFINRGGRGLSPTRRTELERAKRIMQRQMRSRHEHVPR